MYVNGWVFIGVIMLGNFKFFHLDSFKGMRVDSCCVKDVCKGRVKQVKPSKAENTAGLRAPLTLPRPSNIGMMALWLWR